MMTLFAPQKSGTQSEFKSFCNFSKTLGISIPPSIKAHIVLVAKSSNFLEI